MGCLCWKPAWVVGPQELQNLRVETPLPQKHSRTTWVKDSTKLNGWENRCVSNTGVECCLDNVGWKPNMKLYWNGFFVLAGRCWVSHPPHLHLPSSHPPGQIHQLQGPVLLERKHIYPIHDTMMTNLSLVLGLIIIYYLCICIACAFIKLFRLESLPKSCEPFFLCFLQSLPCRLSRFLALASDLHICKQVVQ